TEAAAELWGAQDIVQSRDVAADLVDLGSCHAELAEPLLHLADDARGVVESFPHCRLAPLHELEALPQPVVHLPRQLRELLAEEPPLPGERLRQLGPQ